MRIADVLFCGRFGLRREKLQKDTNTIENVLRMETKKAKCPRSEELSDKTTVKIRLSIDC